MAQQVGKARILYELRQKGVDGALAEQAVAELNADQQDANARKLAEKFIKRYQNITAADARRKTIQAMQRRGYSYGEAKRALDPAQDDTGD
jgi:regulatory protein